MNTPKFKQLSTAMLIALGMSTTTVMAEPTLEFSGAMEIEVNTGFDHTAAKNSDIALATVELGLDAKISENVSAHLLVLHEDDDTDPPVIDEGYISLTKDNMFLNAGRMYVPFGKFDSHMVSDPLTLEIAETQESAILAGYTINGLSASLYIFNGDADQTGDDGDVIDDFGISLGYTTKFNEIDITAGFDYINNMAETDGIQDSLAGPTIQGHTSGVAMHANISVDNLNVIVEYITASNDFNTADISFNGNEAQIRASNIEVAYSTKIDEREVTFAFAHQSSSDVDGSALPDKRNMISASTTIFDDIGLSVEYTDASDYVTADGGTGNSGGMLTAQLAVEF